MATYDRIQRTSLAFKPTGGAALCTYEAFVFPQRIATALRREVFRRTAPDTEEAEPYGIPLWAVNAGIAALLPHVLVTDATGAADRVWLAWDVKEGTPRPDREMIVELVRSGLAVAAQASNERARRRGKPAPIDMQVLARILGGLTAQDLTSEVRELRVDPGKAVNRQDYRLLAHTVAHRLVASKWQVDHRRWDSEKQEHILDGISRWHRSASDEGAELISYPPHTYQAKNGSATYHWSYTLRFTVQNNGLRPQPLLHITLGIRRWARTNVWDKRGIGVCLFTPSPWANGTSPFGRARMKWQPGPKGKREGKMVWDDVLADTLARSTTQAHLPQAPDLASDPAQFLETDTGTPLAGVLFREGLGTYSKHPVGVGSSARDRWQVFHQLHAALAGITTPQAPLSRVPVRLPARPSAGQLLHIDQDALREAAGPRLIVDLAWSTTAIANAVITELHEAFNVPRPTVDLPLNGELHLGLPGRAVDVDLRIKPVAGLAASLTVDDSIKNPRDRRTQAAAPRRTETTAWLQRPDVAGAPRFAVVEMPGADDFRTGDHDPKHPVKAAAGSAGVLVQNLTPAKPTSGEENSEKGGQSERVRKSILDLLVRQNGLLAAPPFLGTPACPLNDITTVGLWIVRRNKEFSARLPLAVVQLPGEPFVRMRTPLSPWLTYREALLTLADHQTERTFTNESVRDFFGEIIGDVCDGSDIALLTLAQNIRGNCPGLNNEHLVPDTLAFDPKRPIPRQTWKGLRHIRMRTNVRSETSQHFAFRANATEEGLVGAGSGLWTDPDHPRLFFSTARKPATAAPGSPQGSRIEAHWGRTGTDPDGNPVHGWKHDTTKNVWNPQLLELLVACHDESDDPTAWASAIHQQRYSSRHHPDPLLLPGVLHMAHLVAKHILPRHLIEEIEQSDS
ncbi:RNaseH domain-containing protein [Kitasatospora sp. NPDC057015]|uniref:RNaseH domain-containing protein n=1 Tax=Kitasatospora sp. NPDC057015 TaxID=3346001 RepID=UPI00363337AE